ncbi:hypothetical protein C0J52_24250 [Blattella germanica]|nr:hypothetical protein C0J52_24250 [Blattella germanica]
MGASDVRSWVKYFKDGNMRIHDEPCSIYPRSAYTDRNKERVDVLIRDNMHITVHEIATKLAIGDS